MLPKEVKREIEVLKALETALTTLHRGALELLEAIRRGAHKCVVCGVDLGEDDEEYCQKHFDIEMSRLLDESKHPDQK